MEKYDMKTSFVAVIGDRKSGKSLLLNKILDLPEGKGFKSEDSEGILMWSIPYHLKKENRLVFFIECSEFNRNEGEDSLFALVYSLSSVIIYNVLGEPNDKIMTNLNLMTSVSDIIKDYRKLNQPKLFWAFRDVNEKTIKQTQDGNFSDGQMIENRFSEFSKKFTDFKRKFNSSNEFFSEKSCFYLPKALETNSTLNKDFLKNIGSLKAMLDEQINGKILFDNVMNGRMMLTLINSALETIRDKNVIDLNYW